VEGEESGVALLEGYELNARVDRGFGLLVAGAGVRAARDVFALAGADGLAGGVVDEGAQECAAGVAGADLEELVAGPVEGVLGDAIAGGGDAVAVGVVGPGLVSLAAGGR